MMKDEHQVNVETDELVEEEQKSETQEILSKGRRATKKSDRSKLKKLEEEKEKLEEELLQLKEKYLRLAAEFDNFKKLMYKEVENRIVNVKEALILDVLPVLDDLDRTLDAVSEEEKKTTIGKGVSMIRDNMKQILSSYGLQEIKSIGEEFDVELHEALMTIEDKKYPPNVVAQEHQKGYKLNNRVIRHAKVAVNKIEDKK